MGFGHHIAHGIVSENRREERFKVIFQMHVTNSSRLEILINVASGSINLSLYLSLTPTSSNVLILNIIFQ